MYASATRLFTTGRGDESQSKELLMTWDNVEDNRRSLLAAPGHHRRWGSVDSEASITIQLSSVPSQRSSVDHSLASSPLRRAQSLTVADPPFAVSGRLGSFFPSARSVDSGASEYTLPSLPSLPSLPPTPSRSPASRAYRGAPSMPAAAAAAAAAVLGPAGGCDPAPIQAAPSVQQAAALSRGELLRLAQRASLTSKTSMASLPSLASTGSLPPAHSAHSMPRQGSLASRHSLSSAHSSDARSARLPNTEEGDEEEREAASSKREPEAVQAEPDSASAKSVPAVQAASAAASCGRPASQAKAADPSPRRTSANALIGAKDLSSAVMVQNS